MNSRQQAIYDFIVKNFGQYDFDRQKELHSANFEDFETYASFQAHQQECILALNSSMLKYAEMTITFIECEAASLHDKDGDTIFTLDSFYYLNGSIVFTSSP